MVELYIDKHRTCIGIQYAVFESGKGDHPVMITPFELKRFMKRAWKLSTKEMKKFIQEE